MADDSEPKDDREWSASVEVWTPAFVPGGKVALSYKRSWQRRAQKYLDAVALAARVDEDEVTHALDQRERFRDVFAEGLQRATAIGDEPYRNTFARFVAA